MIAAMLYALAVPRMMIYSYALLVVPALILGGPLVRRFGGQVAIGVVISAESAAALLGLRSHSVAAENLPFLLTLGIWLAYAVTAMGGRRRGTEHPDKEVGGVPAETMRGPEASQVPARSRR